MTIGWVYIIHNKINDKKYIGQTQNPIQYRFNTHLTCAQNNRNGCRKLYNAIRELGEDNFYWNLLKTCNYLEELYYYEYKYITQFNSVKEGYNKYDHRNYKKYKEKFFCVLSLSDWLKY